MTLEEIKRLEFDKKVYCDILKRVNENEKIFILKLINTIDEILNTQNIQKAIICVILKNK